MRKGEGERRAPKVRVKVRLFGEVRGAPACGMFKRGHPFSRQPCAPLSPPNRQDFVGLLTLGSMAGR